MAPSFPLTVYYAFKQDDEDSGADDEETSVGLTTAGRLGVVWLAAARQVALTKLQT
jgi:hypothetical protein